MILATFIAILVTMAMALIRAFLGPSAYDRMLATNMFGTKTVLLIAVGGYAIGWQSVIDIALLYAMVNFVSTIAIMRFFEYDDGQVEAPRSRPDSGQGNETRPC